MPGDAARMHDLGQEEGRVRVLLAGGGSGGSAAPVIAVAEALARRWPGARFLYVGTTGGPERALVKVAGIDYAAIASGRLRRFVTWRNLTDPALVALGIGQAVRLVRRFQPDLAFGAGGFATVPPLIAARLRRVPVVIHQQDVLLGLANRIVAPFAAAITVGLPETLRLLRSGGVVVGNPVRDAILWGDLVRARQQFGLEAGIPTLLVTGGGTGALALNQIVADAARELVEVCQIVHLTGVGRAVGDWGHPHYRQIDFVAEEMADLLAAADLVVTRAGMSALSEVAALGKPSITVPMPDSHQLANAAAFASRRATIVLDQETLTSGGLAAEVRDLLADSNRRERLGAAARQALPADAAEAVCDVIGGLLPDSVQLSEN